MSAHRRVVLSERDIAVLRLLLRFRLLTSTQLQRIVVQEGSTATQARRTRSVLQRLTRGQLVARLERRIGGIRAGSDGTVYRLTGRGVSILNRIDGTERRRVGGEPGERYIRHVLAVSELFVRLSERIHPGTDELLTFDAEPECWRTYSAPHGGLATVRPDAFVRTASGDYEHTSFVEVDLATESLPTIARKCRSYIAYWHSGKEQRSFGIFPRVVWVVPDHPRAHRLRQVIGRLPHQTQALFAVVIQDQSVAVLLGHQQDATGGHRS